MVLSVLANLPVSIKPEIKIEDDCTAISGTLIKQKLAAKLQTHSDKEIHIWFAVDQTVSRWNDPYCP